MVLALTTSIKSISPIRKLCPFFAFILTQTFGAVTLALVMAYQHYLWLLLSSLEIMLTEIYRKLEASFSFHLIRNIFSYIIDWYTAMIHCQSSWECDLLLSSFSQIRNGILSMLSHQGVLMYLNIIQNRHRGKINSEL